MKMKGAAKTAQVCRNASEESGRQRLSLNQPIRGAIVRLLPIKKRLFDVTHCISTTSVNVVPKQENKEFRMTNGGGERKYACFLRRKSRLTLTLCMMGLTGTLECVALQSIQMFEHVSWVFCVFPPGAPASLLR